MSKDYCSYDVLQNDTYGRYAVASKTLKAGDLIISELPLTYGPKSDSPPVCLGCHCGISGKTLCSKCSWPVCNEQCEKLPIHSENECQIFANVKIKFTPVEDLTVSCPQYECIMPLRVLLLKEKYPSEWESKIKVLEAHTEERKKTDMWKVETVNVVNFLHKVCKLHDRFSAELIHFVCGILEVNSFAAPSRLGYEIRCLYSKTSLLSHSCVPNVGHYIFIKSDNNENFRMYIRAMVKIKKGEELFLSYTHTLAPTLFRRAHLKEGKFFECKCRRCADPTELGTNMSTLKCTKCVKGWVLSSDPLDEGAVWKCTNCEFIEKGETIMKVFYNIQDKINELDCLPHSDRICSRENFIKKHLSVLHPNHALLLSVKCSLTQLYGKAEGYLLEQLPENILKRKIELCSQINKISHKIKPGLSRQRGWNLYELYSPYMALAKIEHQRKEIDENQFRARLMKVARILNEIALIFSYDDPNSLEGITSDIALKSLNEISIQFLSQK